MVVVVWYGCLTGVYWKGSVCFGGIFPCFGDFDVVVCGGGFNRVCIYMCVNCVYMPSRYIHRLLASHSSFRLGLGVGD